MSFSLTALKEVEVTATLELLHGTYYSDFDTMLQNVGELFIFTPGRSNYEPLEPSRDSFFFLLQKDDFTDLQVRQVFPFARAPPVSAVLIFPMASASNMLLNCFQLHPR